jgi:hypothetical protein
MVVAVNARLDAQRRYRSQSRQTVFEIGTYVRISG